MRRGARAVFLGLVLSLLSAEAALAAPPGITSPAEGTFIPRSTVTIEGTKESGASIRIPGVEGCDLPADVHETWSCIASELPNGATVELAPVQTLSGVETPLEPITISVLAPPVISGPPAQLTTGVITGRGHPGANIQLAVAGSPHMCPAPVSADGFWSCVLPVRSGTVPVTARQWLTALGPLLLSDPSTIVSVAVDTTAPDRPRITFPAEGSRVTRSPVLFTGTGESSGRVELYVDNIIVCSVPVVSGAWSCEAHIAPGEREVRAIQRDAAGNFSPPTEPITVRFGPREAAPLPAPPDPSAPQPTGPPLAGDVPALPDWPPNPIPEEPTVLPEALTNWGTPSGFGSHFASPDAIGRNVPLAIGAALVLLFTGGALSLVVRTVAFPRPRIRLLGRNRLAREEGDPEPSRVNPWIAGLVPLSVAAGFVVFSDGFAGEVRYLRLTFAVGVGLALLNLVGVAIVSRLASLPLRVSGRLHFVPLLLVAMGLAALASRVFDIDPPFLVGIIIVAVFTPVFSAARRAAVALAVLAAVSALALVAWLVHEHIGPVDGFWNSIPSEVLATVALAGFGSVPVLLIPLGRMPGAAIMEWSPTAWVATTFALVVLAVAVLLGAEPDVGAYSFGCITLGVVGLLSLTGWAWARWVEPALRV